MLFHWNSGLVDALNSDIVNSTQREGCLTPSDRGSWSQSAVVFVCTCTRALVYVCLW